MIKYVENKKLSSEKLVKLYSSVGWTDYTSDISILEKAIANSLSVITAWDNDELIGLIRCIGDGYTILYIQDLLVKPEYQNKKIGTKLLTMILEKYQNVRQKMLLAEDLPSLRSFYEKLNFVSCDHGEIVAYFREY